jgi:selenocysteine insertion sequence-binding protein 2
VDVSMPARSLYLEKQQDQEEEGEKEGDKEQGRADDSVHPIPAIRINFRSSSAAEAAQAVLNGVVVGGQQVSAVRSLGSVPSPPERLPASSASASSSSSTATSGGGVDHKENDDAPAPEPEISLTRNGKKIPVKYAGAKKVPKIGNKSSVREYVTQQRLDGELDQLCFDLIAQLFEYQERLRLRDPTKAKLRRRLVFGLREVKRGIKIGKIKCVIVAPNIDEGNFEGGLDDTVNEIISLGRSEESCENVIFALSKRRLGKALGKQIKVSAVGVYSMDGAHDTYKKVKKRLAALE